MGCLPLDYKLLTKKTSKYYEKMISENNLPINLTFVSIYGNSIPKSEISVPKNGTSVPKNGTSVPKYETSVPKYETSVPKNRTNKKFFFSLRFLT
jgi:hypothetical protein